MRASATLAPRAVLALLATALLALALGWLAMQWLARGRTAVVVADPSDEICLVAPSIAYDPASGLDRLAARPVPPEARCPVCGMFPARAPRWAAQVIYRDGDAHFFDSPLSLHLFLQDVPRHARGRSRDDVAAMYVSDRDGSGWIAAQGAYYVAGSSDPGPMRAGNLPAFATLAGAQAFTAARGGRVVGAAQIDAAMLRVLDTRSGHGH
jgi:nitrous oxide reductase accessory protein NosL